MARIDARADADVAFVLEPGTELTYEGRTSGSDCWNTKRTEWTTHQSAPRDGRRIEFVEWWDETDEGVMVQAIAFPPVGLEAIPGDWDDGD